MGHEWDPFDIHKLFSKVMSLDWTRVKDSQRNEHQKSKETIGDPCVISKFVDYATMDVGDSLSVSNIDTGKISEEEANIASRLRSCCDKHGKEKQDSMRESSQCLIELGKLYSKYAKDGTGKEKKLNFIKSAALFVGAKVRCEKLRKQDSLRLHLAVDQFSESQRKVNEKDNLVKYRAEIDNTTKQTIVWDCPSEESIEELAASFVNISEMNKVIKADQIAIETAKSGFRQLIDEILKMDAVKGNKNIDVMEMFVDLKSTIKACRKEITRDLVKVTKVQEREDKKILSQKKITQVKDLCLRSTMHYKNLLRKVCEICVDIMGKPPCKFAIVGLGSLAKNEATLYSDFEHAIILEDGVLNDSPMKDYFRWFTTIFHVFIIGLGETVIPSVNVRSLCDLYSGKKSDKWFIDEQTPLGISFDGMSPHACKIPLGRTNETENRRHTVELIQSVSIMANFLTRAEAIKNGYFLDEVLSKTCLIFGDNEVYESFVKESRRKKPEAGIDRASRMILLNPNETVKLPVTVEEFYQDKSIKNSSYRPVTAILTGLSMLYGIQADSSFGIVDEMLKRGIINQEYHHNLVYAVALAMEIRMKSYSKTGHQRKNVTHNDIVNLIGVSSAVDLSITVSELARKARRMVFSKKKGLENVGEWTTEWTLSTEHSRLVQQVKALLAFQQFPEATKLALTHLCETFDRFENGEFIRGSVTENLFSMLFRCYSEPHRYSPTVTIDSEKLEWCTKMGCLFAIDDENHMNLHEGLTVIYSQQERFSEALRECYKWNELRLKNHDQPAFQERYVLFVLKYFIEIMFKALKPEDIVNCVTKLLSQETDYPMVWLKNFTIYRALLKTRVRNSAKKKIEQLAMDLKKNQESIGKTIYSHLLVAIFSELSETRIKVDKLLSVLALEVVIVLQLRALMPGDKYGIPSKESVKKNTKWPPNTLKNIIAARDGESSNPGWQAVFELMKFEGLPDELYAALSYNELIQAIIEMSRGFRVIDKTKSFCYRDERTLLCHRVTYLMVMLESTKFINRNIVIDETRSAPGELKALRVLQPFFFACFADFHWHGATADDLSNVYQNQCKIFKVLFEFSNDHYTEALSYFTSLRFRSCVILLWKLLQCSNGDNRTVTKSIELFCTTVMTILVVKKRRTPAQYFLVTRELSVAQSLHCQASLGIDLSRSLEDRMNSIKLRYCYIEDSLASVINLAIQCLFSGRDYKKCVALLWRLVNIENSHQLIRDAAVDFLFECCAILHLAHARGMFDDDTQ